MRASLIVVLQILSVCVQQVDAREKVASDGSKLHHLQATKWYKNTVHYWPFEEISNRTVIDYAGYNDGRLRGSFNIISGIVGAALEISGNNSWVDFGVLSGSCLYEPGTCRSGFTIAFWLKIPDFQDNRVILQLGQHRFSRGFTIWTRRSLKKNIGFSASTLNRKYYWIREWKSDNWNHIALKWDNRAGSLKIYFNCTLVKVVSKSEEATPLEDDKASRLILGASHAKKKNTKLMVDEFAIWNHTVSDDLLCKVFKIRSVAGNYSEWSDFSPCSVSCGNGTMIRTRNCSQPSSINHGHNCSSIGQSEEVKPCFLQECPLNGGYSQWSVFGNCSKTCGGGIKKRNRTCSNPEPGFGGRNCTSQGLAIKVEECNTQPCPINGGYTKWTEFSQCTVSCGNGTRQRTRSCTSPQPKYGGKDCSQLGSNIEIAICNITFCPIHGAFSEWTKFSKCTRTCGEGIQKRTRKCSNPEPSRGGHDCSSLGAHVETRVCNTQHCPINGGYTQWTKFASCSKTCGKGVTKRRRSCSNPAPKYGGVDCKHHGPHVEERACVLLRWCPVNGGFTKWTRWGECSESCGVGIKNRTRSCTNPIPKHGGKECDGETIDITVCNVDPCPYSPWSKFSVCSKSCANGTMKRTRTCTNPPPSDGEDCSLHGPAIEIRNCNIFPCAIDGNYSSWSNFSVCSKSCGSGTMERTRNCSNPEPKHGGMDCSHLGLSKEAKSCNAFPCPIHGNFSSWSLFSVCSKSCGNGKKARTRSCSNPVPKHGGRNCSALGPLKEVRSCNTFPCPVHGNYSPWSNFSRCSKSCSNGTMVRTRNCSNPTPKHGGKNCSLLGHSKEVRNCNAFPCPIHVNYSTWSNFSACSKSCGNGTMARYRNCNNPQPRHNGKNCSSLGARIDVQPCNDFPCPMRGGYTEWGNFTQCTLSCGNGTMYRSRSCTNPAPQHRGKNCSKIGPAVEIRACNEHPCPIHGDYTQWSEFSQCSTSCGIGTHRRTRQCSNPAPQFGGRNCSRYGLDIDVKSCYLIPCPIDGGYSQWSNFTKCTKSCNVGKHSRTRHCNNPFPRHGGRNCSSLGPEIDVQSCNTFPCPVHGGYSEWSGFESCTRTCGGGKLIRRRTCTNPPPIHGGRDCNSQGPSIESKSCNTQKCPDIVFKITINLTSEKWDPSLAAGKGRKFDLLTLQIQIGIKAIMGKEAVSNTGDFNFRKGSVIVDFSVNLFHQHYQGITALQDAIQVERKIENLAVSPVNLTSPDVPIIAPVNITAINSSSTTVVLTWLPIPDEYSNGPILEYRIVFWKVGNDTSGKQGPLLWKKVIGGEKLSSHVTNLEKFTKYQFRMAGVNRRGVGLDSVPIETRTDQDKPSLSPSDVKASNKSSTTIYVEWSPILEQFVHGILLGYHVHYTNLNPNGYEKIFTRIYQTGPNSTWILITNLLKFTSYQIQVSAFTTKGDGPLSNAIFERTREDVPSRPPGNVTGNNLTSTSIVIRWSPISQRYVHGVLQGYKVSYVTADASSNRTWSETVVNESTTSAVIANLRKFTVYMVSVEGFTSKGSGNESKCVAVTTDEDRPDTFPGNVTGFNSSSTSLFVEWKHIPPQHRNGILLGYNISYFRNGTSEAVSYQTVHSSRTSTTLKNLKKFMWYNIRVAGYTRKGLGPLPPQPLVIRTSEDVPSKPVITLKARNTSHTSLLVEWNDIPRDSVHGILLGFRVLFWRFNESRDTYEKRELLPEEHSIHLKDLWIYTKYKIQILGFTSAGEGTVSNETEVSTDEYIPSQSPVNVQAMNKTSPTKIQVQWKPIPDTFYVHGILRGYKVLYRAVVTADETLKEELKTKEVTVSSSRLFVDLEYLDAYTRYEIEVLAFTIKGDGVKSEPIRAETCNCYSTIFSNWWINPPYVDSPDSNKSGIITPILKESVESCCGNCSEHGISEIDFEYTASRRPARKSGLVQFTNGLEESTELHFPVYGFMDQTRFSNNYGFVPFVQSPGLALIIIGDEKGTAATLLLKSLAFCFPILFLSIAMLWVSSLALWFVETAANERHFPRNILQGSWEAMWWAFASMTTLGYGDRIPRTPFGRLVCLTWILLGVIMVACFNSTMTTLLTARILDKEVKLYGTKIAAIQNSSGYRIAIRKNARVNPSGKEYTNLQEVYEALTSREVKGMLIDAYTVGSKKHLFDRRDLRISKLLDYSAAYGVVLGGEGKKIQKCLQKYVSEQRSEISNIVRNNVQAIEITPKSMSVERSSSLFDPQFPTYVRALIVCGVILGVILLVGAKFEFAKKMGWVKFRRKGAEGYSLPRRVELSRHKEEMKADLSRIVAVFKINCSRRIQHLRQRHKKELLLLAKLKRQANNVLIHKGNFQRNSTFNFAFGLKTPELNHDSERNGLTKHDLSLKQDYEEMETFL